jgi:hypothetical protein
MPAAPAATAAACSAVAHQGSPVSRAKYATAGDATRYATISAANTIPKVRAGEERNSTASRAGAATCSGANDMP